MKLRSMSCLILALCLFLTGCATAMLSHNTQLMADVKAGRLPDRLIYYYCGRANIPDAVVGIDPDYTFDSKFWFKIESREDLYRKIGNLSDLEPFHTQMYAKDILSSSGRVVGIWLSYYNTTAVSFDEKKQKVFVNSPYKPGSRFSDQ